MVSRRSKLFLVTFLLLLAVGVSAAASSRIQIETDIDYSSIIVNNGSADNFRMKLINGDTTPKDLSVSFSGVKAEFQDGDKSKSFSIPGKTNQSYFVRLKPEKIGDRELNIDVKNNNLNLNTTEKIPVTVINSQNQGNREVPGIGFVQIILLSLVSTVLYFGVL